MNKFGAAFRRVSKLGNRKRMDAATTPVARFEYRHLLARTSNFAGSHQACGACADDDGVVWM